MKKLMVFVLAMAAIQPAHAIVGRFGGSYDTTDPEKEFIRVKNSEASSAFAAGDLLCSDTSADDGVSVKICVTTAGQPIQCVGSVAIAAGKYGLCQIYGYHAAVKVSGQTNSVTAGGRLTFTSDGAAGRADGKSTGDIVGIALDSASTSTTVKAFLRLR